MGDDRAAPTRGRVDAEQVEAAQLASLERVGDLLGIEPVLARRRSARDPRWGARRLRAGRARWRARGLQAGRPRRSRQALASRPGRAVRAPPDRRRHRRQGARARAPPPALAGGAQRGEQLVPLGPRRAAARGLRARASSRGGARPCAGAGRGSGRRRSGRSRGPARRGRTLGRGPSLAASARRAHGAARATACRRRASPGAGSPAPRASERLSTSPSSLVAPPPASAPWRQPARDRCVAASSSARSQETGRSSPPSRISGSLTRPSASLGRRSGRGRTASRRPPRGCREP